MNLMYVWGHSYEFDRENNWDLIEDFCARMQHQESVWYATNIEIVDYLDMSSRVQVSVDGDFAFNPSSMSVWLEVDKKMVELKGGITTEL